MYRKDKQFMKNPATTGSRIYIGSLAKTVLADDLEAKFKVHGNILGLVLQAGFAFVQYEHDYEAHAAIKNEHGAIIHGRKINVKQALEKSKLNAPLQPQSMPPKPAVVLPKPTFAPLKPAIAPPNPIQPPQQKPPIVVNRPNLPVLQSTAPLSQVKSQPDTSQRPPEKEPENKPQEEEFENDHPTIRPPTQQIHLQDEERGRNKRHIMHNRGGNHRGHSNDHFDHPPRDMYREAPPYYGRDDYHTPAPYGQPVPMAVDAPSVDRNDCEIIVVSKALTEYAEYIEQQLKQLGLIVDLLFPNEDVPIGRVLANISSRGCLYAILIMPQNEEHRSLTLNVLHGLPQEHRNMPIEDALLLISRNFEAYMRGEQATSETPGQMSLCDRHPVPMQMVLNLLAENRQLTTSQYDKLIKYLQERRELQHEQEVTEGIEPDSQDTGNSKQAELQSRIMNILNKSADSPIPTSITAPDPPAAKPTPLLKDPTVQKALDSLLLGDMFKNMSGA